MDEEIQDLCGPCEDNMPFIPDPDPRNAYEFVGLRDIKISEQQLSNGKKRVTIESIDYFPPVISAEANPVHEIGNVIDFTFSVDIQEGRDEIVSRTINPDPDVDLNSPFELELSDFTSQVNEFKVAYTVTVTDSSGNVVVRDFGVKFSPLVYMGFHGKSSLLEEDISGFSGELSDGVMNLYKGEKSYNVPVSLVNNYIYWLNPLGSAPIAKATLNGFALPLITLPGHLTITNQFGVPIDYSVTRTANPFGGGTLKINLQ